MTERTCSLDGCEKRHKSRGLCRNHYAKWLRGHDLPANDVPVLSPAERFWAKVDKNGLGGCWLWKGSQDGHSYGQVRISSIRRAPIKAHRFAYTLLVGPIPEGLTLDHLCRVTLCVNPAHLEPVTHAENIRRSEGMSAKHARQTECVNGHPLDEANTYVYEWRGVTRRYCIACNRQRHRKKAS